MSVKYFIVIISTVNFNSNEVMSSILHTKNLREYMSYASLNGGWEIHNIGENLIVYNGSSESLFNYVFCTPDVTEDQIKEILSYLDEKNWEATWPVDPHMTRLQFYLNKHNVTKVSAPKKAFLNLSNYTFKSDAIDNSVQLVRVEDEESLKTLDGYLSEIFFHSRDVVVKFLRYLTNKEQRQLNFFLVKKNNEFVGACGFFVQDGTAGFYADGVFRKYRNQGIGSQMILQRMRLAKEMGCENAIAHCMSMSVSVYKKQGFSMLGSLNLHVSEPRKLYG